MGPGWETTVRVEIERRAGRVLLRESVDRGGVTDVSVQPGAAAVGTALRDGTLFAALSFREAGDGVETVTVTYRAAVPDDAADGAELALDGSVRTPDGEAPVAGARTVEVVSDPFERVVAADAVTVEDLAVAGEAFEAGQLSERQVDCLYTAWLGPGAEPPAEALDD